MRDDGKNGEMVKVRQPVTRRKNGGREQERCRYCINGAFDLAAWPSMLLTAFNPDYDAYRVFDYLVPRQVVR